MNLKEAYFNIKNKIVAFVPTYYTCCDDKAAIAEFPPIIGTGFVIHENGLIATNSHVVKCFRKLFKPKESPEEEWPVRVMMLQITDKGMVRLLLDVLNVYESKEFIPPEVYYGPKEGPDLAYVQVKAHGLPFVDLDSTTIIEEGTEVGVAGFPMGTVMLTAPGWLHQITPTVQKGIIAAVHPFLCSTPHSYSVNIMVQGGSSGSPVFSCESGKVIGMISHAVYSNLSLDKNSKYKIPTNISWAVPSRYIIPSINQILKDFKGDIHNDSQSIDDILKTIKLQKYYGTFNLKQKENDISEITKVSITKKGRPK